jgi:UPF0716 protein FxsA
VLRLLLLFTVVPAVELFVLLQLGSLLGPTPTFLIILVTGLAGAWLAKREGLGVLRDLQGELGRGLPPGDRLMEGALVVVGGLLLITPGVFTDLTGFLLIAPWSRRWLAPRALRALTARLDVQTFGPEGPVGPEQDAESEVRYRERAPRSAPTGTPHPFSNPFDDL